MPPSASSSSDASGPATESLTLDRVSFAYDAGPSGAKVVRDVSATLSPGRLTALIGPNAAGKSTLIKLMLGQIEPTAGRVQLSGRVVHRLDTPDRARRISYVPQVGSVSFGFTVRQVVAMGRYAWGGGGRDDRGGRGLRGFRGGRGDGADPAIDAALAQCDLTSVAHRPFTHLSGGQQQRVTLARAIAQARSGAGVLLADEPGSHMDLWHVHRTMQLCRSLAAEGLAVLVVVHDLNLAARYADELWLMHEGRLIDAGPWGQVLRPALLEPVYRVGLTNMAAPNERPVFRVEP